jgi:hypothetical protein
LDLLLADRADVLFLQELSPAAPDLKLGVPGSPVASLDVHATGASVVNLEELPEPVFGVPKRRMLLLDHKLDPVLTNLLVQGEQAMVLVLARSE